MSRVQRAGPQRRRGVASYTGTLSEDQRAVLLGDVAVYVRDDLTIADQFGSESEARRAWSGHGEELMAEWEASGCGPGRRPPGWWWCEAGEDEPFGDDYEEGADDSIRMGSAMSPVRQLRPPGWDAEAERLLALGELTAAEFEALDAEARRHAADDGEPRWIGGILTIPWSGDDTAEWHRLVRAGGE